ncbi:sensor histidine kinase [Halalkalibacterium halodurans]|jgi:signal transduction histidine kinase|uniref:histidine kinase n=1 Tax=Halalkalibacterium halodurans TaxID=86665 RepID=A0A0M0KL43_ALKHA|nr:ATP-binding protein [Halalkalibacterium halodurans]MED4164296.1 ATP-binding protein [Halalkalibacterium halodurans]MED4171086.1 ATP-binding protein [Halalkalibacterium halodurans]TPE67908.1 HAMP domain-containing protein [Halalkalibacterium halodurans]
MKNWSIKAKVWSAIFAIIVAVSVGALSMTFFLYERLYIDKQIDRLFMEGQELRTVYAEHGANDYFFERIQWANDSKELTLTYTEDPMQLGSGSPFEPFANEHLITFDERQQLLEGETVVMIRENAYFEQKILGVAIPLFDNEQLAGALFFSLPLSDVYEPFLNVGKILLLSLSVIILLIILIGKKVVNHVVTPLTDMKEAAIQMAKGDFSLRISSTRSRKDEIGQLAESFNTLSSSLERVEEKRREFLADVSHELRTPLSYMKGYAEGVEEGVIDPSKGLSIIQKEANRLERLVNDLLDLAQLEGESYVMKDEPIAFAQLVYEVVEQFRYLAAQKRLQVHLDLDEDVIISGDPDRIEQVIRNLLDNAIKYAHEETTISLTIGREGSRAQFILSDQGIGIPEDKLALVFERFYRVNKSRSRKKGGTGLGLAIASQIIKKHGGTIDITSQELKGTTVTITLKTL